MTPRLLEAYQKGKQASPDAKLNLAIWTTTPWTLPANMVSDYSSEAADM